MGRRDPKHGMLVTIKPVFETEKNDRELGMANGGKNRRSLATHHMVPCVLGGPCVRLVSFRWMKRTYKVTQRDILIVLKHEEIHHVLDRIDENDAGRAFDRICRDLPTTCALLGCENHQVT